MGIRSRLKDRVRRLVGDDAAPVPQPPARTAVALPPAPVAPPVPDQAAAEKAAAEKAAAEKAAAEKAAAEKAAAEKAAAEKAAAEKAAAEKAAADKAADEKAAAEKAAADKAAADKAAADKAAADKAGPVLFESDYQSDDAPVRTAHHREVFETTDAAIPVRVFDADLDRWLEFSCEPGEYVLDAADRAGLELPFSCRSGGCLSCAGKMLEGQAEMGEQYVLEDEHIDAGFYLLCCTTITAPAAFLGNQEDEID